MAKFFIGLGKFSKSYLYILGAVLSRCFRDYLFGFITINPKSKAGLFGFIPELYKHYLLQDFYRYIGFIIGGFIFMKILKKKITKEEIKKIERKNGLELKGLIHNKKKEDPEKVPIFEILKVCILYFIHAEISRFMYLLELSNLDFWIFDIIFILLFMDSFFVLNYYNHQIVSLLFIIISNSVLLLVSSFLKNDNSRGKNTYEIIEDLTGNSYSFIFIILAFIVLSSILSYSRVKSKVLMYFNYISPYKIIYYFGLIGTILTAIGLIFVTFYECKGEKETFQNYCIVSITKEDNVTEYYYDNLFKYFEELRENLNNESFKFYLEVILVTPFYLAINFFEFTCEILTIYYLNPNYVLIRENLYYCIIRFIFIIVNRRDYYNYMTLTQFFILESSEISALLGYMVYFEIIELRFCNLDKDLKRKIIDRGKRETEGKPTDNEEDKNSVEDSFLEEKNNNNDDQNKEEMVNV